MRRRGLVALVGVLLALLVCYGLGLKDREPVYEGKPLSQWLDAGFEDASRVLNEVGPAAADSIFAKLKREHPKFGYRARYRVVWEELPGFCRRVLPRPRSAAFDEWRACHALLAIGRPVIPVLTQRAQDSNPLVRAASVQALAAFPPLR
jgi:hypothetical protein